MIRLLAEENKSLSLTDFSYSFKTEEYQVLQHKDRIVAGVQLRPFTWNLLSLPGVAGWFLLHVLPHLPILNRLMQPGNQRFLRVGNFYLEEGRGQQLIELLESVLATSGHYSCLAYLDPRDPQSQQIRNLMKTGVLSSVDSKVLVYTRGNCSKASFDTNLPLHISMADSI